MSVSIAEFIEIVQPVLTSRFPVLLRGQHGIGKSQAVHQLGKLLGLPLVERRAAQMTEGDMIGLPDAHEKTVTRFLPPDWLKRACDEGVLLFFDEVDRAQPEVRMGIFQILDSREFYGNKLHPDTLVFAAINGGTRGAVGNQYLVNTFCPAEMSRWTVFDIEPTIDEFMAWAKDKFDPFVWNFLNENKAHIEHSGAFESTKKYPDRRSWFRLNLTLVNSGFLKDTKASAFNIRQLADAFVGFEAANALQQYALNYSRSVKVTEIVDDGKFDLLKDFNATGHAEFIEKMDFEGVFKDKQMSDIRKKNIARYFVHIPSEHSLLLWHKFGGTNDNTNVLRDIWPIVVNDKTGETVKDIMAKYLTENPELGQTKEEEKA